MPAGGSMITAGDDISIAWGELSGMPRYGIEETCTNVGGIDAVSYTHLTLPTTPYV